MMAMIRARLSYRLIIFTLLVLMMGQNAYLLITSIKTYQVLHMSPQTVLERGYPTDTSLSDCAYSAIKAPAAKHQLSCFMFIAVLVRPSNEEGRHVIRSTWYSPHSQPKSTCLKMFIGTCGLDPTITSKLLEEQSKYGDLILLDQLLDSYDNLTRKSMQSMSWVVTHVRFTYLFKCDDDAYPLLDRMVVELRGRSHPTRLYWGYFIVHNHVPHRGRNKDIGWFLSLKYMPFAIGGAYILSSDLVNLIVGLSSCVHVYRNEDASLGLWLAPYEIERKHDTRFCRASETCHDSTLVYMGRSLKEILALYKE